MSETFERYSNLLQSSRILVGVTASVAAYRVIDVIRLARRHGASVKVLMTKKATRYVTRHILRWASGSTVHVDARGRPLHVELGEWCSIYIIAPCTLNTLAKIAHGICDNLVTLTAQYVIGRGKKLLLVPCMSLPMWENSITQSNVQKLRLLGIHVLQPDISEGRAKFPEPELIVEKMIDLSCPLDMTGIKVLVTAGATREYIDPVKFLTTPSTGLTGVYFAREAYARGASVHLVLGYVSDRAEKLLRDVNIHVHRVKTTEEMYNVVKSLCQEHAFDIAIFTAAPLDYSLEPKFDKKIDTDSIEELSIRLKKAPKVIDAADNVKVKIGFKAEWNISEDLLISRSTERLQKHGLDIVVAHDVSRGLGFGTVHDSVLIIDRVGLVHRLEKVHKRELARLVLTRALKELRLAR